MAWVRWIRARHWTSWHITTGGGVLLCGRAVPGIDGISVLDADPPENEKTCETCLRVSHRDIAGDL